MSLPRRSLTINFQRPVTSTIPGTMEVVVSPLAEPSSPGDDVTLVGGPQTQIVLLDNEVTPVVFNLVPSDQPGLSGRVLYRIAWRERFLGRQYTRDFVMPDADVNFADLDDLASVIGGETYVQWSDRGRAGGVAGLNSLGQVIDVNGAPVGDPAAVLSSSLVGGEGITVTQGSASDGSATFEVAVDRQVVARRWSGPVQPASGSFGVVQHNLGTTELLAAFRRADTRDSVVPVVWKPGADGNTLSVMFDSPPAQGEYWAVVIG